MKAQHADDLLYTKKVILPVGAVLVLVASDQSYILRVDNPGFTINRIFVGRRDWEGKSVSVLPNPLAKASLENKHSERITIFDANLAESEVRIEYYNAYEVQEFFK